jgi:hypothetical protein
MVGGDLVDRAGQEVERLVAARGAAAAARASAASRMYCETLMPKRSASLLEQRRETRPDR